MWKKFSMDSDTVSVKSVLAQIIYKADFDFSLDISAKCWKNLDI